MTQQPRATEQDRATKSLVRRAAGLVTVAGLAIAACSGGADDAATTTSRMLDLREAERIGALVPFDACGDLEGYVHDKGTDVVGAYGWGGDSPYYGGGPASMRFGDDVSFDRATAEFSSVGNMISSDGGMSMTGPPPPGAPVPTSVAPKPGEDYSETNNQVRGVDEPDTVKTDGERIYTLLANRLVISRIDEYGMEKLGSVTFDAPAQSMLIDGDTVLILGGPEIDYGVQPEELSARQVEDLPPWQWGRQATQMLRVDISDPAEPTVTDTITVDGALVAARMANGQVRIVLNTPAPELPLLQPTTVAAVPAAQEANDAIIENTDAQQWLPQVWRGEDPTDADPEPLMDCDDVSRPIEFGGFGMVSVVTIDPSEGIDIDQTEAVMGAGENVMMSAGTLYVSTTTWVDPAVAQERMERGQDPASDFGTTIHAFDVTGEGPAAYQASGQIEGHLLNQYSMDEHEGVLRVATTEGSPWCCGDGGSESHVVTLRRDGAEMRTVGDVGGIGRGEEIRAVRFLGDLGYVVTFRQTDPLFTLDLSDPAHPSVAGELKIPGFSSYLHPIGEGYLLGVGRAGDESGRIYGPQVSLFDVRNPAAPARIAHLDFPEGSELLAEQDPHAFLWWAQSELAVLPLSVYGGSGQANGAVAIRVTPAGLDELRQLVNTAEGVVPLPPRPDTTTTTEPDATTTTFEDPTTTTIDECASDTTTVDGGSDDGSGSDGSGTGGTADNGDGSGAAGTAGDGSNGDGSTATTAPEPASPEPPATEPPTTEPGPTTTSLDPTTTTVEPCVTPTTGGTTDTTIAPPPPPPPPPPLETPVVDVALQSDIIAEPQYWADDRIERVIVVAGFVVTVSDRSLLASDLDTLTPRAYLIL